MTKVNIRLLETGLPGFDELLGGGVPEFSFNLLAGTPGSGKTTMAHQIMFSLASPDRRAIFFTVLGEPALKMLRYQQQFPFFSAEKIDESVKFVNLAADLLDGDFNGVLERIKDEVRAFRPSLVFVDSFRSVVQSARANDAGPAELQHFVHQLGVEMTGWLATSFLIGEYVVPEAESSPVFTVADGIIWLSQLVHRDAVVRKIQIVKLRGHAQKLGVHAFRINDDGIQVFPRAVINASMGAAARFKPAERLSLGVPAIDAMLGGGLPAGYALLVGGPSGSGKTILATQFLEEGVRIGEPGVIAAFEKSPNQLHDQRRNALVEGGSVGLIDLRALDLSLDEVLHDLIAMVTAMQARRVVIDSLAGLELALAPVFHADLGAALYRLVAALTHLGATVLITAETEDRSSGLCGASANAFLADAILTLRYVDRQGRRRRVLSVDKVRGSAHSDQSYFFDIADDGIHVRDALEFE